MNLILSAPLFGSKHLIGLFVVLALVVLALYLVERNEVPFRKVILVVTIGFLVFEALKLGFIIINNDWKYPMNHIPLHLCSLPLYLYPIIAFSKRADVVKFVLPAAYSTVLFGGLIAMLYPSNILGGEMTWALTKSNYLPYVSFIYHGIMIFAPIYLLRSKFYKIKMADLKEAFIVTFIFMVMAIIANLTLDQDYMILSKGTGSPFAFLLDIHPVVYTVGMIIIGFIAVAIFHSITCLIVKKDVVDE